MNRFFSALSIATLVALTAPAGAADPPRPLNLGLGCYVDAPDMQFLIAPPCPEVPAYVPEKVRATVFVTNLQQGHSYSFIWTNCFNSTTSSCASSVLLSQPTTVSVLVTDNTTGAQQSLDITLGYGTGGA